MSTSAPARSKAPIIHPPTRVEERQRRRDTHRSHDHLVEHRQAAGPEMAGERAERPRGIAEVHQHEPADDRIEALVGLKGLHIRDGKRHQ